MSTPNDRTRRAPRRPEPVALRRGPVGPVPGEVQVLPTDQPPEGATSPDARPRLSFAVPPARGKAPKHLADYELAGRKKALKDAGLQPFRADQLSRHYFTRFTRDAEDMTDLPAGQREQLAAFGAGHDSFMPRMVSSTRLATIRLRWVLESAGTTYQGAWSRSVALIASA